MAVTVANQYSRFLAVFQKFLQLTDLRFSDDQGPLASFDHVHNYISVFVQDFQFVWLYNNMNYAYEFH